MRFIESMGEIRGMIWLCRNDRVVIKEKIGDIFKVNCKGFKEIL